jgi:hypothetical protein
MLNIVDPITILRGGTVHNVYIFHVIYGNCTRITHDMMEEWRLVVLSRGGDIYVGLR